MELDDEWLLFLNNNNNTNKNSTNINSSFSTSSAINNSYLEEYKVDNNYNNDDNLDDDKNNYLSSTNINDTNNDDYNDFNINKDKNRYDISSDIEKSSVADLDTQISDIYISTKTNIIYLNNEVDIYNIFWKLPVIDYDLICEGIVKKQVKISCINTEELENINKLLENEKIYSSFIINSINNPEGRIKFKHIQKISVGISKKDLITNKIKEKSAFYNCFVMIVRVLYEDLYHEIHVKIFNTGKIEIPGIKCNKMFEYIINKIVYILTPYYPNCNIWNSSNKIDTILINSNFYCNFNIKRQELYNKLRLKYNIHTCYDPCSYPGIQCVFYYNNLADKLQQTGYIDKNIDKSNYTKISFMIFRTGSILIVGKCNEEMINFVYNFIKNIIITEYSDIYDKTNVNHNDHKKKSNVLNKKHKKHICYFTN